MRHLFFKIFAILWVAQSLIFVASTAFIVRHRFPDPDILYDTLYSSLSKEAKGSVTAFESGGCDAFEAYANEHSDGLVLQDESGRVLCPVDGKSVTVPMNGVRDRIGGTQVGDRYFWTVPTRSTTGKKYSFQLGRPHTEAGPHGIKDVLRFAFPQMPVAIAVGGATTFILVLLFTRPLVKLRRAARSLAEGNLSTRVASPASRAKPFKGDEFEALIHDFDHMAERLESLVGAQKLLLRDVSHELRSPLARLSVALELAREDADPGLEMDAHLNRIERETKTLNQLIGQLLTLSSMEASQDGTRFGPVSLNGVIALLLPDAAYEAQQRERSVDFKATATCVVSGNQELLYRAVENVVRNAIRYTETGSTVAIRLTTAFEENRRVAVLDVSDFGPGIPESEIHSIFRPFYRVDPSRAMDTGGFGVGLAIADRAVKLHAGSIKALNRFGGGATIRITLPILVSPDPLQMESVR